MKAVLYDAFSAPPRIVDLPDPEPEPHGVVVAVRATGVCRSDWHGWRGHDPDITLPHVPGHELAGVIAAVGRDVRKHRIGERVTVPFVGGCGACPECAAGHQQVCPHQFQPGFTHWGSFAEYVSIHWADTNLVPLPDSLDFTKAASLGCRFATAFRAVVDRGEISAGQWLAVHGCGGVGLSAILIAAAIGANVVAVDIARDKLSLAEKLGSTATVDGRAALDVAEAILEITGGGAHVSIDALGHPETCRNSIECLRRRGKHVQVGLLLGDQAAPPIPLGRVISHELEVLGSHGMQAHRYDVMLSMILAGTLQPERLIGRTITLEESIGVLTRMDSFEEVGVTIVTEFRSRT